MERIGQMIVTKLHNGPSYFHNKDDPKKGDPKIMPNMPAIRGDAGFGSSGKWFNFKHNVHSILKVIP